MTLKQSLLNRGELSIFSDLRTFILVDWVEFTLCVFGQAAIRHRRLPPGQEFCHGPVPRRGCA